MGLIKRGVIGLEGFGFVEVFIVLNDDIYKI